MGNKNRANVETLMLYPEETRLHILEATKHPEALIRMQNLQTRSQTAFRALVETYPERVQQQVWDLTRDPSLIERLVVKHVARAAPSTAFWRNIPPKRANRLLL